MSEWSCCERCVCVCGGGGCVVVCACGVCVCVHAWCVVRVSRQVRSDIMSVGCH